MKILVSCANGSGTSLMMMRSVQKAFKRLNLPITQIEHTNLAEGKSTAKQYDMVFTTTNFVDMFKDAKEKGVQVIGVKNVMRDKEVEQRVREAQKLGFTKVYVPKNNLGGWEAPEGIEIIGVSTIGETLRKVFK